MAALAGPSVSAYFFFVFGMGPLVARPRVLGLPPGVNVKLSIYLISLDPRDFAMRPLERLSLVHSSLALRLLLLC